VFVAVVTDCPLPDDPLRQGDWPCEGCDRPKRYCLAGEEGPKYPGIDVDVPVPAERTAGAVAGALIDARWGVQKRLCDIAEECVRVCPASGGGRAK